MLSPNIETILEAMLVLDIIELYRNQKCRSELAFSTFMC